MRCCSVVATCNKLPSQRRSTPLLLYRHNRTHKVTSYSRQYRSSSRLVGRSTDRTTQLYQLMDSTINSSSTSLRAKRCRPIIGDQLRIFAAIPQKRVGHRRTPDRRPTISFPRPTLVIFADVVGDNGNTVGLTKVVKGY